MSVWRARARERIAELVKDLPENAPVSHRRHALWGKGYPAHLNTYWGEKMWDKEVLAHLERHGDGTAWQARGGFEFPEHVSFPFRGENDA